MANNSLTDRATIIAAGLCANSGIVKSVDISDPSALATHAVRIARAVRDASREKSKDGSKREKSKRDVTALNKDNS